ncbi:hypothetical protein BMW24_006700 [Mycobacterium heckeshornense]|uniref:Uncharacterized protein n=1 Tax=Mycobacterium heckeshornense TaxID=110505 RepID=A0A2G8BF33_9MYCO|nr:hypothetical protein [Mycobacterium heckeshornense]KMV22858.1 hypothetical protein ACT16_08975 [Mycobacterium heckeshornense]MCV7033808.1 hypothetical protein [Mycobacterium heckeshornense]PIJ36367.1 hypothetical protein BMW24_006700 [Mycobacterium heckeshornense]BCO34020.1 hypothetical protein MHEC_04530 [Mycobacterium heckeshornense]
MAFDGEFRVSLEALAHSAAHVSGQGENLAISHLASDNKIDSAQPEWVGASSVALVARMGVWLETSRTLLTRVSEHEIHVHNDGIEFAAREREAAEKLRAVGGGPHRMAVVGE